MSYSKCKRCGYVDIKQVDPERCSVCIETDHAMELLRTTKYERDSKISGVFRVHPPRPDIKESKEVSHIDCWERYERPCTTYIIEKMTCWVGPEEG